jgi:RNA-binding protein
MLTSKQRSYLRSIANTVDPIFQVGKDGIGDNMIKQFYDALEAREIVKTTVLKNADADVRSTCEQLAKLTHSEIVQVIGNKFVLYRESGKNKNILLP